MGNRDTSRKRGTLKCARVVALLALLCSVTLHAAPQWSLTLNGDPALLPSESINQSSSTRLEFIVQNGSGAARAATAIFVKFVAPAPNATTPHLVHLNLGRELSGGIISSRLLPGTYTDIPAVYPFNNAPLQFSLGGQNGVADFCHDSLSTFTINALEFVDRSTSFDDGLAHLDVDFTTTCAVSGGRARLSGHFVYTDPARRAPLLSIVRGTLWEDLNKNGLRDVDETTIPGSQVAVRYVNANGLMEYGTEQQVDENGNYELRLPPGTYRLQFTVPSSFRDPQSNESTLVPTQAQVGTDDSRNSDIGADGFSPLFTVSGGEVHGPDAGFHDALTTLEGHAWVDANRNGVREDSETALPISLCFYSDVRAPLNDKLLACVPTDEAGYFSFDTYLPFVYVAVVAPLPGWRSSLPGQTSDENRDSDLEFSATPRLIGYARGGRRTVLDLGAYSTLGSVSGVVWDDSNHDGVRQAQEARLAGVRLELRREDANFPFQFTTTDSEGRYTLTATERSYYVQLVRPSDPRFQEYIISPRNIGSDGSVDSNFFANTLRSENVTLVGATTIANIDVGFSDTPRMPIRGRAWLDSNGNGVQNAGEPPLPGKTIRIARGDVEFASVDTDANGEYEISAPVGYRYTASISFDLNDTTAPVPTLTRANGGRDSDLGYDPKSFLLTTTAPIVRDIGYFYPARTTPSLADYFPLAIGNKWVHKSTDRGEKIVCSIPRMSKVNGVRSALFSCSDGQMFTFTLDKRALRLHSLRMTAAARMIINSTSAQVDVMPAPAMLLARTNRRPGGTYFGRTGGKSKVVVTASDTLSSTLSIDYSSSLSLVPGTAIGWMAPQLKLTTDFVAERDNGKPISLGVGMLLGRDIGPVAFVDTATGQPTAKLTSYYRDADKDGRSAKNDNCPKLKNPSQADLDQDGVGDACDVDLDDDRVNNIADNCPRVWNEDQADSNGNGVGDACAPAQ